MANNSFGPEKPLVRGVVCAAKIYLCERLLWTEPWPSRLIPRMKLKITAALRMRNGINSAGIRHQPVDSEERACWLERNHHGDYCSKAKDGELVWGEGIRCGRGAMIFVCGCTRPEGWLNAVPQVSRAETSEDTSRALESAIGEGRERNNGGWQ
jgi:hypothetical protein